MNVLIQTRDNWRFWVSPEVLAWHAQLLLGIGKSYHYRLELARHEVPAVHIVRRTGLRHLSNTLFLQFIIDWCKIFANPAEKSYWLRLYTKTGSKGPAKVEKFKKKMKEYILQHTEIPQDEYATLIDRMKNARDKYAAHLDIGDIPQMPFLEPAFRIANVFSALLAQQDEVQVVIIGEREDYDIDEIESVILNR